MCTDDYCNQLGDEGWELIYTTQMEEGKFMKMIFKRPKA
jgi:hypothetical protein